MKGQAMSMIPSNVTISANHDDDSLKEKYAMAEATFGRASESLNSGKLSVEHRRFLNALFTNMVASEKVMCW